MKFSGETNSSYGRKRFKWLEPVHISPANLSNESMNGTLVVCKLSKRSSASIYLKNASSRPPLTFISVTRPPAILCRLLCVLFYALCFLLCVLCSFLCAPLMRSFYFLLTGNRLIPVKLCSSGLCSSAFCLVTSHFLHQMKIFTKIIAGLPRSVQKTRITTDKSILAAAVRSP